LRSREPQDANGASEKGQTEKRHGGWTPGVERKISKGVKLSYTVNNTRQGGMFSDKAQKGKGATGDGNNGPQRRKLRGGKHGKRGVQKIGRVIICC